MFMSRGLSMEPQGFLSWEQSVSEYTPAATFKPHPSSLSDFLRCGAPTAPIGWLCGCSTLLQIGYPKPQLLEGEMFVWESAGLPESKGTGIIMGANGLIPSGIGRGRSTE